MKDNVMKKVMIFILIFILINVTAASSIQINSYEEDISEQNDYFNSDNYPATANYDIFETPEYKAGTILIKFKQGIDVSTPSKALTKIQEITRGDTSFESVISAEPIFRTISIRSSEKYGLDRWVSIKVEDDIDILQEISKFQQHPNIECVGPDYIVNYFDFPNDPYFDDQWALHNYGQEGGTYDVDIDAPEAWDIEKGDPNITIAVIDTGVDYNHEDLADNIWMNEDEGIGDLNSDGFPGLAGFDDDGDGLVDEDSEGREPGDPDYSNDLKDDDDENGYVDDIRGWNFYENNNDPLDDYGHGTHCSGIIGAVSDNGIGLSGVCRNCQIMALRVGDESGGSVYSVVNAIIYAIENGADVISMSIGVENIQLIIDALNYAYDSDIVCIAATGNANSSSKTYPAAYDNVIAVASTNHFDQRSYVPGPFGWGSNYGDWVDIAAPGSSINSTLPNNDYLRKSGTSMACPHAAGLAALLISKNQYPHRVKWVKTILRYTTDEIETDEYIGTGRINAHKALQRTPAIAFLDDFQDWTDLKEIVDITGIAWGECFHSYTIEYGKGKDPATWIEIYSSTEIRDGLLTSWDTTQVDDGLYTIKLKVNIEEPGDLFYTYENRVKAKVNNLYNHYIVDDNGGPDIDFSSIQDAADDAGNGDTIYVKNGNYFETIVIDGSVDITGQDRDTTIIDGNGKGYLLVLEKSWVNISGFTFKDCTVGIFARSNSNPVCNINISGNKFIDNEFGIELINNGYNTVIDNIFEHSVSAGLFLHESNYNLIYKNVFNNSYGPLVHDGFGMWIRDDSRFNNISGNIITNNNQHGIYFQGCGSNNIIYNNFIANNAKTGIHIRTTNHENLFYHNNFINNTQNVFVNISAGQKWDQYCLIGGNYWDDYIGVDDCNGPGAIFCDQGDGFGDTPYDIHSEPSENPPNIDNYPLMCSRFFIRGDINANEDITINDAIYLLKYLYVPGSALPSCMDTADVNDDGIINLADAIFLLNALYTPGAQQIPPPCGDINNPQACIDQTPDNLNCEYHPCMECCEES